MPTPTAPAQTQTLAEIAAFFYTDERAQYPQSVPHQVYEASVKAAKPADAKTNVTDNPFVFPGDEVFGSFRMAGDRPLYYSAIFNHHTKELRLDPGFEDATMGGIVVLARFANAVQFKRTMIDSDPESGWPGLNGEVDHDELGWSRTARLLARTGDVEQHRIRHEQEGQVQQQVQLPGRDVARSL